MSEGAPAPSPLEGAVEDFYRRAGLCAPEDGAAEGATVSVPLILEELGKPEDLITYVKDRPGHDRRYAIDNTKITTQLGWAPKYTFETGMASTIDWYLRHGEWMEKIVSGEYMNYYEKMYSNNRI